MNSCRAQLAVFIGLSFFSLFAAAINGRTTYQANIVKPDGYPLEAANVSFRFTVTDNSTGCTMYIEDYAAVSMVGSRGLISFALGNAASVTFPASGVTSTTFQEVFNNTRPFIPCQTSGSYNPALNDSRKIIMQFNDGSGWQTLPPMSINSVPYAMYASKANVASTLNNKADTAFVEYSTLASLNCNSSNEAITFNGVSFSCVPVGVASSGISSVTTSGSVLVTGGTASAPVISIQAVTLSQDGYLTSLDYAEFKAKLSASSTEIINTLGYAPVSSSTVASQIASATLAGDVSGNPGSNTVNTVGGKTSSQISTSVDDTLAATTSATANTLVRRDSSGNVLAAGLSAVTANLNYVDIYKPSSSFNIRLQAPTSLSSNYILNLPSASGTTGQVLSTDGAGNLSWINPSTGSVVSVSATAPLASTGGSTPTLSITQATTGTDGYFSATDWSTFNNKQQATSSAIIATLGYEPADVSSFAAGSVPFVNSNGALAEDNSQFFWDNSNKRLGIGTSSPTTALDVNGSINMANNAILKSGGRQLLIMGFSGTTYLDSNGPGSGIRLQPNGLVAMTLTASGLVGIGTTTPTAKLNLSSGTVTVAPLKFTSGAVLTTPQAGSVEYDGLNLYFTDGSSNRRTLATTDQNGVQNNTSQINSAADITLYPNSGNGSVVVSSTVASTNAQTGALVVRGGLGVAGNIFSSGTIVTSSDIQGASITATSGISTNVIQGNTNLLLNPNAGNVGIGTSNPQSKLEIITGGTDSVTIKGTANDASVSAHVAFKKADGSTIGYIGDGSGSNNQLQVTSHLVDGIANYAFNGGDIIFNTSPNLSGYSERMRITNSGNVGIGTVAPSSYQHGGSVRVLEISNTASAANSQSHLIVSSGSNDPSSAIGGITAALANTSDSNKGVGYLGFITATSNTVSAPSSELHIATRDVVESNWSTKMIIKGNGNVGVGTTNPNKKLHVLGGNVQHEFSATNNQQYGFFTSIDQIHMTENAYYDGQWKSYEGGAGESAVILQTQATADHAFLIQVDNTVSATNEVLNFTNPFVVKTNGNVGIGTTNPGVKLEVQTGTIANSSYDGIGIRSDSNDFWLITKKDGSGNRRNAVYSGSGGTPLVLQEAGGNVGIGTANPLYKLDVNGNTRIYSNNNWSHGDLDPETYNGITVGADNPLNRTPTFNIIETPNGPTNCGSGNENNSAYRGGLGFGGSGIYSLNPNVCGSGSYGELRLYTTGWNGTNIETRDNLTISSSGNVGVGTNNPNSKLDVAGAVNTALLSISQNTVSNNSFGSFVAMDFRMSNEVSQYTGNPSGRISSVLERSGNGYGLAFTTRFSGATGDIAERMRILADGNVGIGTVAPSQKLHVVGDARIQGTVTDCYIGNGSGGTSCSSDERLKTNIKPIPYALEKINSLRGVEFEWNALSKSFGRKDIGVIAQDVEKVFPTAVITGDDGYKKVDYAVLVAPLIQAVKEIHALLINQERKIASIGETKADREETNNRILQLEKENKALKDYLCSKDATAVVCK